MLIDSAALTPADRAHWKRLAGLDVLLASDPDLARRTDRSIGVLQAFAAHGDAHCSTSWGKDSTVLVDLVGRAGVSMPLVWLRIDGYDNPDCEKVRDVMLAKHPHLQYTELTLPPQPNRWWDAAAVPRSRHDYWKLIEARYGPRRATGIRAEESAIRDLVMARFGDATDKTCRPIGRWTAVHIFAYLAQQDLPVHPAYAMSIGGQLDRRWLRVHSLGGVAGLETRSGWETRYYGDHINRSRLRDHIMHRLPDSKRDALPAESIAADSPVPASPTVIGAALDRLAAASMVAHRTDRGGTRWYRCVPWPPAPTWEPTSRVA